MGSALKQFSDPSRLIETGLVDLPAAAVGGMTGRNAVRGEDIKQGALMDAAGLGAGYGLAGMGLGAGAGAGAAGGSSALGSGLTAPAGSGAIMGAGGGAAVPLGSGITPGVASAGIGGGALGTGIGYGGLGSLGAIGAAGAGMGGGGAAVGYGSMGGGAPTAGATSAGGSAAGGGALGSGITVPAGAGSSMGGAGTGAGASAPSAAGGAGTSMVDNLLGQMRNNALALGLIGGSMMMQGQRAQMPNQEQIQGLSAEAQQTANQLLGQYRSGQLSASQQAGLQQLIQNTKNQLNQYFSSIGQADSTAHMQALAQVDQQAFGMQQQMLDTALQQGLAALGVSAGPLNTIAQYQLGQDQALRQAYGNFAGAIGQLFGRNAGTQTQGTASSNTGQTPSSGIQLQRTEGTPAVYPQSAPLG